MYYAPVVSAQAEVGPDLPVWRYCPDCECGFFGAYAPCWQCGSENVTGRKPVWWPTMPPMTQRFQAQAAWAEGDFTDPGPSAWVIPSR